VILPGSSVRFRMVRNALALTALWARSGSAFRPRHPGVPRPSPTSMRCARRRSKA